LPAAFWVWPTNCTNMSYNIAVSGGEDADHRTGASLGQDADALSRITEAVKDAVGIPVFVKLTPEGGRIAETAEACIRAGADAVVSGANRLGIPPIDIRNPTRSPYALQLEPSISCLSGPWTRPLAMRDVYEIRRRVGPGPAIAASGGIMELEDVATAAMCGADLICICTGTMLRGFEMLPPLMGKLKAYMHEMGYAKFSDMRDILVREIKPADELTIIEGFARKKAEPAPCEIAAKCGLCARICPSCAITFEDDLPRIDGLKCHACGLCVQLCPQKNFEMVPAQQCDRRHKRSAER